MATVKYGALNLYPAPEIGLALDSRFFGADIRYSLSKVYSLKGILLSNEISGFSGIFNGQNDIVSGFRNDYLPFEINGTVIGYPQVKSISFDDGNLVQKNGYSIELEFLESGNPFQLTGANYAFTGVSGLFNNIQSLTESLEYNTDFRTFNYTHSVQAQIRTGFNIDPLLNAKIIASGLINNKAAFPFIVTGSIFGNKKYEERENVFDGSYSVTESFDGTTGNLPYDHLYSINLRVQENGITQVSQQGQIRGFDPDKYTNAKSGYNVIRHQIYQNCSGFYAANLVGQLNTVYLADSRTDNVNTAVIQYARNFTDESGVSDVRWQYTHQSTLDGNFIQASEQGSIIGLGHISERFYQASGFYNTVRTGVHQRTLSYISGFGSSGNFFPISEEQSFNRFNGDISYNYGFSNTPGLGAGSGIQNFSINITDDLPTHNTVAFTVVNVAVMLQSLGSTSNGQRTVNYHSQAFRDTPQQTVLDFARDKINGYIPTGGGVLDPFINNISLNYNPMENTLDGNVAYLYGGNRSQTNLKI